MVRTTPHQRAIFWQAFLCALLGAGCGEDASLTIEDPGDPRSDVVPVQMAPPEVRVSGVVNLDGQPLPDAAVSFYSPDTGVRAYGRTDQQGRYRLVSDREGNGLLVGRYFVAISTAVPPGPDEPFRQERVPSVYNSHSTLAVNLFPEMDSVDWMLRSDVDNDWHERLRSTAIQGHPLNVVLFVAEGLGAEWVGCYGGEGVETPNIDALAARGLKFNNAYTMPQPVSARVTLLTGQYPCRHGWLGDWNVPNQGRGCCFDWEHYSGLPRRMSAGGYATSIVGQWQLNNFRMQPDALLHHGFRRWCVWPGGEPGDPATHERFWNPHLYLNSPIIDEYEEHWPTAHVRQYDWGAAGTFSGEFGPDVLNAFLPSLIRRRPQSSFFLYYAVPLPGTPVASTPDDPRPVDEADRYRAMVRYTDKTVGRLVTLLTNSQRLGRTLIIFTSDGGAPATVVGRAGGADIPGGRGTLTERGVRVPLIVSGPDIVPAGAQSDALIDFSDLAPTISDVALLDPAPDYDGHSFAPQIVGFDDAQPREWIMSVGGRLEFNGETVEPADAFAERVLRDQRFKVHVDSARTIDALYDLAADPTEKRNLIDSSADEHRHALEKFRAVVRTLPERDAAPRYTPLAEPVLPRMTVLPSRISERSGGG